MENWAYDMVNDITKMNKPPKILGPCIGVTLFVDPFQVQIKNSTVIIDKDNGCVCRQLRERKSKFKSTGSAQIEGSVEAELHDNAAQKYNASGAFEENGDIELDTVWNVGDEVLVVPSGNGQYFFIVDILEVK